MFDRLVESEPVGTVRSRRNYFVMSTLAMGVISLTAVVVSIFADDYSLHAGMELSELIAPVQMASVAPEQPQPRQQRSRTTQTTEVATRTDNIRNLAETPDKVPPISTTPSSAVARPLDRRFEIGPLNADPANAGGVDPAASRAVGDNSSGIIPSAISKVADNDDTTPPPVRHEEAKKPTVSLGVINGKALSLPVPAYSAAARAVHAQGRVTVQVTLDETGKVVSAAVVEGSPLLAGAAVEAARHARFSPTLLSGVPVKVTGVIVYNFNLG